MNILRCLFRPVLRDVVLLPGIRSGGSASEPTGQWILITGAWADAGEWDDADTWNDGA